MRSRRIVLATSVLVGLLATPARADGYGGYPPFIHPFGTRTNAQATSMALTGSLSAVAGTMRGGPGASGGIDGFLRIGSSTRERTIRFGTSGTDRATGVAGYGTRFAVVGWTTGTFGARPNAGGRDGFVRMYSGRGDLRWARSFGTVGDDIVTGVTVSWDHVVVTGSTTGAFDGQPDPDGTDAFLVAYAIDGSHLWTRQFGSDGDDAATGISIGGFGPLILSGTTSGDLPLADRTNAGGVDGFTAELDASDGSLAEIHQFGTAGDDTTAGVDTIGPWSVVAGTTDGVFEGQNDLGGSDGYMASFWNGGDLDRVVQFGTDADDHVDAVVADGSFVYAAGTTAGSFPDEVPQGGLDGFVTELDTSGDVVWTDQFGGPEDDVVTAVTTSKPFTINQSANVAGFTDHAAFIGFRRVPQDMLAKSNLLAALAIARRWADAHGGSFAELTPTAAGSVGFSFAWFGDGDPPPFPTAIAIADARADLVRLVTPSVSGTYFCLEELDGVVMYGQSTSYEGDSCAGGW